MKEQIFESWEGRKDMAEVMGSNPIQAQGKKNTGVIARGKNILLSGKWKWKFGGLLGKWN